MTRMVLAALLLVMVTPALADVLLIDEVRQVQKMELPDNGVSKDEVAARFGEPDEKHAAVGEPPISRWDYDTYSVYFEYNLVLFTVLHPGEVIDPS